MFAPSKSLTTTQRNWAMEFKDNLTAEYVRSILDYNPETGIFVWRERPIFHFKNEKSSKTWNKKYSGKIAGCKNGEGYIFIYINKQRHRAHHLAFLYIYKEYPNMLDHKNKIKDDNRIINLRKTDKNGNNRNRFTPKNNSSGYKGVCWSKKQKKWISYIRVNNIRIHLGSFDDIKQAALSYNTAAEKYHKDFATLNIIGD